MKHLEIIENKIITSDKIFQKVNNWNKSGKKIVFTNGCFDLIHRGHIDYLSKAADLGDILVIGLNTDSSVRRLKGNSRPINDEYSRALVLASMCFIDCIIYFDDDTPYNLIKQIQPDFLVKGSDYKIEDIVGYDIVQAKNGKIVTIDYVEGYSTTNIENKILKKIV